MTMKNNMKQVSLKKNINFFNINYYEFFVFVTHEKKMFNDFTC